MRIEKLIGPHFHWYYLHKKNKIFNQKWSVLAHPPKRYTVKKLDCF